jgi:hypothetical protein
MTASEPIVRRFSGAAVREYLDAVAALRIAVFRDWPYLYDGDRAYEREYLDAYAASPDSVFVLAFAGDDIVGASTGLPLADDSAEFRAASMSDVCSISANRCCCRPGAGAASAMRSSITAKPMCGRWGVSTRPRSARSTAIPTTRGVRSRIAATRRSGPVAAMRASPA